MRFLIATTCFLFFGLNFVNAQKFGYFDSEYVLSKLPEYSKAQGEIDQLSAAWQKEVEEMQSKVDALYRSYQAEQVLLTEAMKTERLDEIKKKEIEVRDYQKKVFGYKGLHFLKRQELIKPLQDKIFDAVEKVCKANRLAFLFDKSELVMVYTDPRHDYTDFILEELGLGDPNDKVK